MRVQLLLTIFLFLGVAAQAVAQHPIDVERKAQAGEWLEALSAFRMLPSRRVTPAAALAAAKSAWALGLVKEAKTQYDRALLLDPEGQELSDADRSRILFSRGIIEFQEGNYQAAIVFAGKASDLIEVEGPLKAEIFQLWGEALLKANKPQLALEKCEAALNWIRPEGEGDLHYLIATAAMTIGQLEKAEEHFTAVPLRHSKSGLAMKGLGMLALENKKYDEVTFWLTKGRQEYPDVFLDSWVDFALVKAYAASGDSEQLKKAYENATATYPPSDGWLILLQATAEESLWQKSLGTTARASLKVKSGGAPHGE